VPETPTRLIDKRLVEAFGDEPVIGEGLKFGGPVVTAAFAWEKPVEVDLIGGAPLPLADDSPHRAVGLVGDLIDFIEEIEKLGKGDLSSATRCVDDPDLALVDPALERRAGNPQRPGRISRTHGRSGEMLQELADVGDLCAHIRAHDAL
jgi:hypothetical protein